MKSALFHFFSFILILKIRQSTKIFLCARQNFEKLIISQSTTQGSRTRARSRKRVTRSLENSLQFRNGRDKGWHDVSQHFFGRKIFFFATFLYYFSIFFIFIFYNYRFFDIRHPSVSSTYPGSRVRPFLFCGLLETGLLSDVGYRFFWVSKIDGCSFLLKTFGVLQLKRVWGLKSSFWIILKRHTKV